MIKKKTNLQRQLWYYLYNKHYRAMYRKSDSSGRIQLKKSQFRNFTMIKIDCCFTEDFEFNIQSPIYSFSMFFLLQGDLTMQIQNWESEIKAGEQNILYIRTRERLKFRFKSNIKYSFRIYVLNESYVDTLTNKYVRSLALSFTDFFFNRRHSLTLVHKQITPNMYLSISSLDEHLEEEYERYMSLESKILELLDYQTERKIFRSRFLKAVLSDADLEKVKKAKEMLLHDLHDIPTIKQTSLTVGLNEKKLMKGFILLYHSNISDYMLNHRMNIAQDLLRTTDLSIYEVGFECGYEHASHFSTAFKRKLKLTPKQFREIYRKHSPNTDIF